jgi:hypothetical protein
VLNATLNNISVIRGSQFLGGIPVVLNATLNNISVIRGSQFLGGIPVVLNATLNNISVIRGSTKFTNIKQGKIMNLTSH